MNVTPNALKHLCKAHHVTVGCRIGVISEHVTFKQKHKISVSYVIRYVVVMHPSKPKAIAAYFNLVSFQSIN